ncbi:hypothetical protein RclHR1_00360045 [Rhizophagus clarus]|uniref:Alpha/beta hydrolase n=1 Tax=Rhizophagus clarus TaxID=94130 RepID=A0A2Z6S656_9GLOM|nr:hypothetical protein RclHR1_00360045 [Rhizophagus clarus]GES84323.1 alpha/beta hydrolase [Rhizophagus clarus]
MSGKIIVNVNREAANLDLEVTAARQEKLRKKFENESFWPLVKKGPLGSLFYGIFLYPRIFFDHFIMENSTYSISIYQETILRSIKRSMNSPLKTLRKSGRFMESLIKTFRCSEHFVPLEPEVRTEIGVKEGYWLGSITYEQKESEATILYLHGGGYIALSSLLGLRSLCYLLKQLRKQHNRHVRVLAIDYDLAPEDPFPNGLNCVERTYNWLINSGISGSKNVFLCGDSAGGGLALGLLQKLYPDDSTMKTQTLLPLGVILLSPWVELSCDSSSFTTNAKFDWISLHLCQFAAEYYIFGKEGNPSRKINQISQQQQPKIHKDTILDWLENVEENNDLVDLEGNSRLKRLSRELSRRFSYGSKRNSEIRARKRGSKARIQKRNSLISDSFIEDPDVDSDETLRVKQESLDKNLRKSYAFSIKENNPYKDPFISPLHISHQVLAKFPPLFISYGGKEIFKDDIEMFTQKCIESKKAYKSFGNNDYICESLDGQHPDVTVEFDENMVHDYPMFIGVFGKHSKKALNRVVDFIADKIPTSIRPHSSRILKSRPQTQVLSESTVKYSTLSSTFTHVDIESSPSSNLKETAFPNSRRIPSIAYIN